MMARKIKQPQAAPRGLPEKPPHEGAFKKPVAWLGGRELLANLKLFALHALFGDKLDSRDWMTGVVNVLKDEDAPTPDAAKATEGEVMYTRVVETARAAGGEAAGEFWFDYFADTGDGQMPIYNIAYLCMTDLYVSDAGGDVHLEPREGGRRLPRGGFLFAGGDTAYHVADYGTLAQRFQAPFWWAYRDLVREGKIPEAEMCERRPLFGIPANHDYYDALDGFNRQFRRPITGEDDRDVRAPQLQLPTFERHQEASYVALRLPFDWWLWGIDTENDEIDFRQQKFFEKLGAPKKLILATPAPTTVFGKYLEPDSSLAKVFKCIGLRRPFLRAGAQDGSDELAAGECRLDLSGDIHYYARYFGPQTETTERPRGDTVANPSYASVISGGGGAFFDPTNTYFGEIREQAIFPSVRTSLEAISQQILNFLTILRGGSVHYIGALIAFVICFAALVAAGPQAAVFYREWPLPGTAAGLVPVAVSTLLLVVGNVLFKKLGKIDELVGGPLKEGEKREEPARTRIALARTLVVGLFVLTAIVLMAVGLSVFRTKRPLPPLGDSLLIFVATVWAALMAVFYTQYTELLNQQAKDWEPKRWESWPAPVMLVSAAVVFCAALWFFGLRSVPAQLFTEVAFIAVVVSVLLGLFLLAVLVGGARHGLKGRAGYVFIGLWHALLQLSVPLLWTLASAHLYFSKWYSAFFLMLAVPFVAYFFFRWLGVKAVGPNYRKCFVALWVLYGLVMLAPPALYLLRPAGDQPVLALLAGDVWKSFGLALAAGLVGAVMSCIWFGWYLAAAMVFNGHNNEAGGAARLVGYKQFIRIRLTPNDLTAYVIGFDKARPEGRELAEKSGLRLVDHFTLTVK